VMSRDPHWYSTIYGAIVMIGQGLIAFAFQIIMLSWLSKRRPMSDALTPTYLGDLAGLMFAGVVLWAYMSFSQYLIIWAGNLPEEITWYVHRLQTGWRTVGLTLVVFHFVVPFCLLLSRTIKRAGQGIIWVASLILFARLVDLFWLIAPEFHRQGISVSWMDVVLPATLACLWLSAFVWQLRGRAILPVNDPQFEETIGRILERGADRPSTVH
jgi:hypothetical protein